MTEGRRIRFSAGSGGRLTATKIEERGTMRLRVFALLGVTTVALALAVPAFGFDCTVAKKPPRAGAVGIVDITTDEFTRIVVYVLLGSVALTAVLLLLPGEDGALDDAAHMRLGLILVATTVAFRALARYAWRAVTPPERTLLLGEGPLAAQVRRKIELFPDIHVRIADEFESCSPDELRQRPGPLDRIDRVIVATPNLDEELLSILLARVESDRKMLTEMRGAKG